MENHQVLPTDPVATDPGQRRLLNGRIISFALLVLGTLLLVVGLLSSQEVVGFVIGLLALLAGLIFYRRGK